MTILRQSTAVDVLIGPFVDEDDGKTLEEALTISQGDVRLSKNGQALAQKNDATACAFDDFGCYNCELDATDTNTVGELVLVVFEDGALPFRAVFQVVEEAIYDALYAASATGLLPANVTQIEGGDASDALAALDDATLAAIAGLNDLDAAGVRAAVGLASANLDTQLGDLPTNAELTTSQAAADDATLAAIAALSIPTVGAIADQVWDEAIAGHAGAGSTGEALSDAGGAGTPPTAEEIADQVWDEAIAGHAGAGSTGEALAAASAGSASGAGAITWVVEIDDGTDPIEAAHVWVSTDEAGSNIVAGSLLTDSFGLVTFFLDAGTYYVHVRKDGFNPLQAEETVVS
jgi:hypothetical protein